MKSFRFARRSFLAAVGGAFGLRVLLDNMVASAAGATSPPRFLMTHWPLGTVKCLFKPTGSGSGYTPSPIVQPFVDAGLRGDMTVLYGLSQAPFDAHNGGGHEAGTVMMTTGQRSPGTRMNGGEGDDSVAGGPSFDQVFLKNVPALATAGLGYVNAICDARVDSLETSTQCLSYGHTLRSVTSNQGGNVTEAVPLMPELSPARLYASLFTGFMPGGAIPPNQEEALRALKKRKSVLDFALRELAKLKSLAPASEHWKIDAHAEIVRKAEQQLEPGNALPTGACTLPGLPDAAVVAQQGSKFEFANPVAARSDEASLEQLGQLHMGIITAAFQCDLARVATFQWCPGGNRVAFQGKYPGEPSTSYLHHPLSHKAVDPQLAFADSLPPGTNGDLMQFLANVQIWFNQKHAALLATLKSTKDFYGNSLLDHTVVPYMTDVSNFGHGPRTHLPAFVFGGKALGMQHGQFLDFEDEVRHQNDLWASIAQAYLGADALGKLSAETFHREGVQPIAGLWQAP
jgi:hypothetical protein